MSSPNTFSHHWVPSGSPVLDGIPGPWHHSLVLRGRPGPSRMEHCLSCDARKKTMTPQSPWGAHGNIAALLKETEKKKSPTDSLCTRDLEMGEETRWKERWKPFTPLSTTRFKIKFKLIHQTPEKSLWLQETLMESPSPSPASSSPEQRFASAGSRGRPEPCRNAL